MANKDVKFTEFPGRNTPLLDRPFGNASPGCFIFARSATGLNLQFPPVPTDVEPANKSYARDGLQWALGDPNSPLTAKRYSTLAIAQKHYAEEVKRGTDEHRTILSALGSREMRNIPSRVGIEATIILDGDVFVVGNHTDLKVNPTRSPIPYSGFAVSENAGSTMLDDQIAGAVMEMSRKQLSLPEESVLDGLTIHTIYTLGRRLQTQIACTIDLRGTGITQDDIVEGYRQAEEGLTNPKGRHYGVEFLNWDTDTIERFAGSHSYRPTKQNLSSVFFAAASDGLISEEQALEYVGARSAEIEHGIASNGPLNQLLDQGSFAVNAVSELGPGQQR